jgi:RNA polymerase sigma-70 factor (ECF subfamily)
MDPRIVRRAQDGDEEAFAILVDRVVDRFLGAARRILRDPQLAEDAAQQALLSVWRFLPDLRDPERFDAWAYKVLVKTCYSEARRRRRWQADVPLLSTDEPASDDLTSINERDRLERALQRLSVDHRTVLALVYYLDLPLNQVAVALDVPTGTVKSRLHRAQRALRSELDAAARQQRPDGGSEVSS